MIDPIDWKSLTPDARNQLVAEHLFGWQPEPCPSGAQAVWADHALLYLCSMCGAGAETPEQIEHGPINAYPCYSENMDAAFLVLNQLACDWIIYGPVRNGEKIFSCDLCISGRRNITVLANSPTEAVCIAALRAIGLEVQQ